MSLIEVSHLSFAYEGSYDSIFENVSFQVDSDWKLGLIGRNGRGKTTLLQLLLGKLNYTGSILSSVSFAYFPFFTDAALCVMEVIRTHCPEAEDWQILRELSLLQVSDSILDHPFGTLSHGEQTKALLASLFINENRFLLIDEPTNHLDADGRKAVSAYLNRKRGFIVVSHDRAFLDGCVDHILSINRQISIFKRATFPPGGITSSCRTASNLRRMKI
jgi:lincosamide and streptogramin A transport system ATP-binding/permease protein